MLPFMSPRLPSPARTASLESERRASLPDVDERLVMPETRYEAIDGKITYVCPSDEPHGTYHSMIAALLGAYVVPTHRVAVDMLTRTSAKNDLAPDASVFPAERDPRTGGRRIEELAFEVVSTETLPHAGRKAQKLLARGVRRVFAIDVERRRALEWSRRTDTWEILAPDGAIVDPTLVIPLPLLPLADAVRADDAVANALLAKKNPVLQEALDKAERRGERKGKRKGKREGKREGEREGELKGKREGELKGKRDAVLRLLTRAGIALEDEDRARILGCSDTATLDAWLDRVVGARTAVEVLSPGPARPRKRR
jgi:Uma2 family endonuclease